MLEFTDRYRVVRGRDGRTERVPAWVCDECPHVVFVRAEHQPAPLRAVGRKVRAVAKRELVKPRAARALTTRALQKSHTGKKHR